MNMTFTLIGSFKCVLALIREIKMGHRLRVVKRTGITNHKSISDNSVIDLCT